MDHLDLGSAPANENCAQIGVHDDYPARAKRECRALAQQLMRICGQPPPGVWFRIMRNPHDFGTYYSLAVEFDPNDEDAVAYAYRCDKMSPSEWDAEALRELGIADKRERTPEGEAQS